VRGSSHIVFGLAGAVVLDSVFHFSGAGLGPGTVVTPDLVAEKTIYYGFAVIGALAPDIDNARSTIGKHAGIISKEIQHLAGHRTLFHSLLGMALVGGFIWGAQYLLGLILVHSGLLHTGAALGVVGAYSTQLRAGAGVAFTAFLVGYFLHLCADSLTEGGVPWLWPNHVRLGFPPGRRWRFRSGSPVEPFVVLGICAFTVLFLYVRGQGSSLAVSQSTQALLKGSLGGIMLVVTVVGVLAFLFGISLSIRQSIQARVGKAGRGGTHRAHAASHSHKGLRAGLETISLDIAVVALVASTLLGILQLRGH
jgi:inner membrane protein